MTKEEFVSALNRLSENDALLDALDAARGFEEIARLLTDAGLPVSAGELERFAAGSGESELREPELDNVMGGVALRGMWIILRNSLGLSGRNTGGGGGSR